MSRAENFASSAQYAKDKMKVVLMATDSSGFGVLTKIKKEAKELFEGSCTEVDPGGTLVPKEDDHDHRRLAEGGGCYELHFEDDHAGHDHRSLADDHISSSNNRRRLADASFKIDTSHAEHLAIWTELAVTEFAPSKHYLQDAAGNNVLPTSQINPPPVKPWGVALGAAFLVVLVTLTGVIFLIPVVRKFAEANPNVTDAVMNSFAGGALLGAAFFLLLMEASHLTWIGNEGGSAAVWGSATLVGFLTASLLDALASAVLKPNADTKPMPPARAEVDTEKGATSVELVPINRRVRVISGILVGDFLHNICDGIFIGTAFLACNHSVGWSVTAATIYHEIAQEASDFLVLTSKDQGGLSIPKALICNVISGLSVVLGVVIVLAQSSVDNMSIGLLLAYGGGVYVQLGAAECMPKAYAASTTLSHRLLSIFAFVLGAVAIGLVLFDHKHCSADAGADAHAGHNH